MTVKHLLGKKYGDAVDIEYIDVTSARLEDFPEVKKHVDAGGTPLPVVAFGTEPAWAGAVSFPHIVQELTRRGFEQK